MLKTMPTFMPVKTAAYELGISPRKARTLIAKKKLAAVKDGRSTLIRGESVTAYAKSRPEYELTGFRGRRSKS